MFMFVLMLMLMYDHNYLHIHVRVYAHAHVRVVSSHVKSTRRGLLVPHLTCDAEVELHDGLVYTTGRERRRRRRWR